MSGTKQSLRRLGLLCLALVPLYGLHQGEVRASDYEVLPLPPLESPEGVLPFTFPQDLNDRGQVVGIADGDHLRAGFRFSRRRGMELLAPRGLVRSIAKRINNRGHVYGALLSSRAGPGAPFLYTDREGFDFLREGRTRTIRRNLTVHDIGRDGTLVGSAPGGFGTVIALRRRPGKPWEDLREKDPRFGRHARALFVNRRGDVAISVVVEPEDEGTSFQQEIYLLLRDGTVVEVGHLGSPWTVVYGLNAARRAVGVSMTVQGADHAYVFTPERGIVDIHPDGFKHSGAEWLTAGGSAGGWLVERGARRVDGLFVHDDRKGLRIAASRDRLGAFARELGFKKFKSILPVSMNDRFEFIGTIHGLGRRRFFHLAADGKLQDLQEAVHASGSTYTISALVEINNRGQILVDGRDGGRHTAALLMPVD